MAPILHIEASHQTQCCRSLGRNATIIRSGAKALRFITLEDGILSCQITQREIYEEGKKRNEDMKL